MKRSSAAAASGPVTSKIEIADGFAPAPQAPAGVMASTPGVCRQMLDQIRRPCSRPIAQQIASAALAILRDGAQHLLFQLRAHARQLAQLLFPAEAFQFVDGADVEVLEDQRDALGAQALDLEELERARRETSAAAHRGARTSRASRSPPARQPDLCRCRECR